MVGIIGAGISGLATAHFLEKANIPYQLLESSECAGGYIRSKRIGKYLFEFGPNSILCDADTLDFISNYVPDSEIIKANEVSKSRFVYKKGKYRKLPDSPLSLLTNSFFSWSTKFNIITEMYRRNTGNSQETLSDFFLRRFNPEVVNYALNPFVSGIYAGDAEQLLLHKTFPALLDFEQEYGSVLRGMMKNKSTTRKQSVTFKDGMQTLPNKMAEKLTQIHFHEPVVEMQQENQKFLVRTKNKAYQFNKLIVTIPAFDFAPLCQVINADFSNALSQISYSEMCAVHTVIKKSQTKFKFDGFGGLNPKIENQFSAGSIWSSRVFDARCPDDEILLTSFVGGVQYIDNVKFNDHEIKHKLTEELQKVYKIDGRPVMQRLFRWKKAIPQYDRNIVPVHTQIEELEKKGLFVCANWVGGVSIADRIRMAQQTVERINY